jgi:hypothetical protein
MNKFALVFLIAVGSYLPSGLSWSQEISIESPDSNVVQSLLLEKQRLSASIRSEEDLQLYLLISQYIHTPFNYLSSDALERFVDSLHFSPNGLGSYYYADLEEELDTDQRNELLSLFGTADDIGSDKNPKAGSAIQSCENPIIIASTSDRSPDGLGQVLASGNGDATIQCTVMDARCCGALRCCEARHMRCKPGNCS